MSNKELQTATFGGGCFWCVEAVIQSLKGVEKVVSGYSGGHIKNPAYREVCEGRTGHAEVVQVHFDPELLSYDDLLIVFMTTHNPTTLNQQGADKGTQYRSIILYHDQKQQEIATEVISALQPYFDKPIVTEVKQFEAFYEAEEHHQNYYVDNPEKPYCSVVISPKLSKLRQLHADKLKG